MKKVIFLLLTSLLTLTGCSEKPEETEGRAMEESKAGAKEPVKQLSAKLEEIEKVVTPKTIEEFAASKPGELTKDFEFDSETAFWPAPDVLSEIKKDTEDRLRAVLKETDDPEMLFKSFIFYLGNSAYGKALDRVISIKPDFDEPFLLEPEEMVLEEGEANEESPEKSIILLDASSSMLKEAGGEQKMAAAKSAVRRFAKTIGAGSDVSLFVYGHAGTQADKDKELSCSKIDEIYPMQPYNEEMFFKAVEEVEAKGWTPLAQAIKTARESSSSYEGDLTVYIVSDGSETCGGNPVEEAKKLAEDHEGGKVNIIGFDVDQEAENQLKKVAEAGNGEYFSADHPEALNETIKETWVPSGLDIIGKKWSSPKNTFPVLFQQMEVDQRSKTIKNGINKENMRFEQAIDLLISEELIDVKLEAELRQKAAKHKTTLEALTDELAEKKKGEIDAEVDRIDKKINDWAERMEKIRRGS